MRIFARPLIALAVLAHLGCCFGDFAQGFQEGFGESFCAEYRTSFTTTCTNTCVQSAGEAARASCATGCEQALTTDATWVAQCTEPVPPG